MNWIDATKFEAVWRRYPNVNLAVPPRRICGPVTSNRSNDPGRWRVNYFWDDFVQSLRVRTVGDSNSLVGPVEPKGSCLDPLPKYRWFDPTLPAQHGDIVLAQVTQETTMRVLERSGRRTLEHIAEFGLPDYNLWCKALMEFGGEYWLAEREVMIPLGDAKILGVAVRLEDESF